MVSFPADTGNTPADAAVAVDGDLLKLDSLPIVDIRLLSQLELYSLSLCCSSSFDPHRCDDVVIPKIDRSVFNESAGSRKQTYSRLRLAPPSSSPIPIRRRTPHLRTTTPNFVKINDNTDPENADNSYIITLLKELFYSDVNPDKLVSVKIDYSHPRDELVPIKIDYSHSPLPAKSPSLPLSYASIVGNTSHKRKRGRPRKNELFEDGLDLAPVEVIGIKQNVEGLRIENETDVRDNLDDREKEFVDQDGVAVDFVDLERVEHPFWKEIMHDKGLKSEEELLGFLKGLDGQWGSRRKKRRIVDAREFGSALPIGWKHLLSIKKRNGRLWLYCRRYIRFFCLNYIVAHRFFCFAVVHFVDMYFVIGKFRTMSEKIIPLNLFEIVCSD
ncbi:LOW QUALITY PROTEIN: methyl-CpG-binding domain-containing protein 8-like [Primulina eburnea]|uniref:LOW QUALITY PROTEIN: methyl-CpG-binding domain-containing protein 8-like n=1 Tax=Primulina eburnea TaxID=1245227 RepID=UPI003C6C6CF2